MTTIKQLPHGGFKGGYSHFPGAGGEERSGDKHHCPFG